MPRSTDTSDISSSSRVFIKTMDEWPIDETREYYYVGHEKVEKFSQRTGKPYTSYYVYLLKIVGGKVGGEETLSVFASAGQSLKDAAPKMFQKVSVQKTKPEQYEEWVFKNLGDILPEKERPQLEDYPDVPSPTLPQRKADSPPSQQEINIDDIPF